MSGVPDQATLEAFPGLMALTSRHFELLRANEFRFPDRKRTIDLSQGISRARPSKDAESAIVTPTCHMYLGHRCRVAHGREALSLQGLHFGDGQRKADLYDHAFLLNLGGNAFMTLCFGAVSVVKEVLLSHCFAGAARVRAATQQLVAPSPLLRSLPASALHPESGEAGLEEPEEEFTLIFNTE